MTTSRSRWGVASLVAALVLAGVASVAFALGVASQGTSTVQAAGIVPGHPELGTGWYGPANFSGSVGQVAITITKIDGTKLSLQTTDGWTRTVDAAGAAITKAGKTITVADLKVGDTINFREARQTDGTYKVTSISVVVPSASGTVKSVGSNSVTINVAGGTTKTLTLTGTTTYTEAGATVGKSALVVGVRISAQGTVDSAGNFTATAVTIAQSSVQGTVTSKTATTIVVKTNSGSTVTVDVTSTTKYTVRGVASATLASVAVGDRIAATGMLNSDGSLTAKTVVASPNDQPGFGGFGGNGFPGFGHGFGGRHGASPNPSPSAGASSPSV